MYNNPGCNSYNGDCKDFNAKYTRVDSINNCKAPYPSFLGDGKCDGGDVYNSPNVVMMVETALILTNITRTVQWNALYY